MSASTSNSTYVVWLGDVPIRVTRKAVRNVNIRIRSDGSVHMSVPWRTSRAQALAQAQMREEWILANRQTVLARRASSPRLWATGESIRVWGREAVIRLSPTDGQARVELVGGELVRLARARRMQDGAESVAWRGKLVEGWLREQVAQELRQVQAACEQRVGHRATAITLRRMKTRWGSCTPRTGRIRLNTALAECPRPCLAMVLTHELCHLEEANHGPRFHALMDRACPNWRKLQAYLDQHPPRCDG